ncbi:hypothetical protein ACWEN3_29210 [Streptomyces sp. NPDC004561]
MQHCSSVATLNDGQLLAQHVIADAGEAAISREMVGRDLDVLTTRTESPVRDNDAVPALGVTDLRAGACEPISFRVQPGEVLGIGGRVGCGSDAWNAAAPAHPRARRAGRGSRPGCALVEPSSGDHAMRAADWRQRGGCRAG